MSKRRESLVSAAVEDAGLPAALAHELVVECPWLDGEEEVSEELGPELLAEQVRRFNLSRKQVDQFLSGYNNRVRSFNNPQENLQSEAYAAMANALADHGREGVGGDFWLVADSFSTATPTIIVFKEFRFSVAAIEALQRVLCSYAGIFAGLRIASEEGDAVLELRPT